MKTNDRNWTPTLTLAKLFEEQNQFFDALAAYELISQTDSSPAVRERIEALHVRILTDPNNRYDPRIEKLFTPEELAYLKILNHNGFENMAQASQKLREGMLASEIYIEEDEDFALQLEDERDQLVKMLREIEQQAQLNLLEPKEDLGDLTLRDLLLAMLGRFDAETRLADVKLSDLVSIFLELQGPKARG
jgi:hypothetical protein